MKKRDIKKAVGYNFIVDDLQCLSPREYDVIRLFYFENMSMLDIGEVFTLCKERVRQILNRSITKLKQSQKNRLYFISKNKYKLALLNFYLTNKFFISLRNFIEYTLICDLSECCELLNVDFLKLKPHVSNTLAKRNIVSINELLSLIENEEIFTIQGIGQKSVDNILEQLQEHFPNLIYKRIDFKIYRNVHNIKHV